MEKEKKKKSIGIPNVRMGRRGRAMKETKKKKPENSQISQHPRKKNISALSRWRAVSRRYAGQKLEDETESKELFPKQEVLCIQMLMGGSGGQGEAEDEGVVFLMRGR